MAITFDYTNKQINLTSPHSTSLDVQELINAIRDVEDSAEGIQYGRIADSAGKDDLGGGVLVGITVKLLSPWQIKYPAGSYQATIFGGNLVGGLSGNPIAYSAGVQVKILQSANGVIAETGVSGLTSEEAAKLLELWQRLGLDASNPLTNSADGSIQVGSINIAATPSGEDIIQTRQ